MCELHFVVAPHQLATNDILRGIFLVLSVGAAHKMYGHVPQIFVFVSPCNHLFLHIHHFHLVYRDAAVVLTCQGAVAIVTPSAVNAASVLVDNKRVVRLEIHVEIA